MVTTTAIDNVRQQLRIYNQVRIHNMNVCTKNLSVVPNIKQKQAYMLQFRIPFIFQKVFLHTSKNQRYTQLAPSSAPQASSSSSPPSPPLPHSSRSKPNLFITSCSKLSSRPPASWTAWRCFRAPSHGWWASSACPPSPAYPGHHVIIQDIILFLEAWHRDTVEILRLSISQAFGTT